MNKKVNKRGFTLVEIIVVLLIIGILLAITIPSIMGYIGKAEEAKILTQARSVLLASKDIGSRLAINDKIAAITNDENKNAIMDASGVDGNIIQIYPNKANDNSGDFIVKIKDYYAIYDDEKQEFEITKTLRTLNSDYILATLMKTEGRKIISDYFTKHANVNSLDSEGPNTGKLLNAQLEAYGINPNNVSYRIYKTKTQAAITISETKITTDMVGQYVDVTYYDFGKDVNFTNEYTATKQGKVKITTKSVDGVTYAVFDPSQAIWDDK